MAKRLTFHFRLQDWPERGPDAGTWDILVPVLKFCRGLYRRRRPLDVFVMPGTRRVTYGATTPGSSCMWTCMDSDFQEIWPELRILRRPRIGLWLTSNTRYPRKQVYLKSQGEICWDSWEEEVLFVLAHEIHHVNMAFLGRKMLESRAENFARRALRQWRRR